MESDDIQELKKAVKSLTKKLKRRDERIAFLVQENKRLSRAVTPNSAQGIELPKAVVKTAKKRNGKSQILIYEYPDIFKEYRALCKEWNLKTLNLNNTASAMLAIFSPDENGVTEYTSGDLLNYIRILRRIGRAGYMTLDDSIPEYYPPRDSLVLFKHFVVIREKLLKKYAKEQYQTESLGIKKVKATLNGHPYDAVTVACTLEDVKNQKLNEPHPNDKIPLEEFAGDDKIREYMRREAQKIGYFDIELLKTRMEQAYVNRFGSDFTEPPKQDIIVLQSTPILDDDEDDDISLSDFKEVK